jgi:hypothetical protein
MQISGIAAGSVTPLGPSDGALSGETVTQSGWGDRLRVKLVVRLSVLQCQTTHHPAAATLLA